MPYTDTGCINLYHEDSGAEGPPVLLLHQLGSSSESWARVIPRLLAERRVIAVDLRCAERSEKPPGSFELTDLADDLAALALALDLRPVDVIGAALGSVVGALLAIRHPGHVRRLMMCAVAPDTAGATRQYLADRAALVRTVGMRDVADASLANSFPDSHAAARAAYRAIYLANDPAAYAELSLALARQSIGPADWGSIAVQTLVAPGAKDFPWPPSIGRRVADMIPNARYSVLTEAGHFPHLQDPGSLTRMALGFFAG
jgi:3-oxoadipate enol-lactonase